MDWKALLKGLLGTTVFLFSGMTCAQDYPTRPIRMIVPWPPGGIVDPLAVSGDQRLPAIPNVPTMAELGYPDFKASLSIGAVMGPVGIPPSIVTKLNAAVRQAVGSPEVEKMLSTSERPLIASNEELMELLKEEIDWLERAAKIAGFKPS